jgi:hypothetical protein
MQALKALVIFMGILIAVGVAVIGVTIYRRATDMATSDKAATEQTKTGQSATGTTPGWTAGQAPSPAPAPAAGAVGLPSTAPTSFGARNLDLPPGSEILSVQTVSLQPGVERVLIYARQPDGGSRVLVLDPLRGNVAGEWRVPGSADSNGAPQR